MNHRIIPIRERFRKKKKIVVFICTGNTCRSPMAATYFRKLLDENSVKDVEVRSAGVMTITGLLASQEAIQVMQQEEIDLSRHRSSQLTPELIRKADLILAMTPFHRQTALRVSEEARKKTYLLKEFTRSDLKNVQIADPMGCTLEVFKKCFKEIKAACVRLVAHDFILGKTWDLKPMTAEMLQNKKAAVKRKPVAKKAAAPKKSAPAKKAAAKPDEKPAKAESKPSAKPKKQDKADKPDKTEKPGKSGKSGKSGGSK